MSGQEDIKEDDGGGIVSVWRRARGASDAARTTKQASRSARETIARTARSCSQMTIVDPRERRIVQADRSLVRVGRATTTNVTV